MTTDGCGLRVECNDFLLIFWFIGGREKGEMELQREKRSTRGKRMNELIGEELDADETFWNQDAFAEEEEDLDFEDSSASEVRGKREERKEGGGLEVEGLHCSAGTV